MAMRELQRVGPTQPLTTRSLDTRAVASYPIAHQDFSIGVDIVVVVVPINVVARAGCGDGVRQWGLDPQIEFL
jgi:hypothetical protein